MTTAIFSTIMLTILAVVASILFSKYIVKRLKNDEGAATGQINQRRGVIVGTTNFEGNCVIEAEVPLTEMFGYSTDLRSATKGKGEFSMEFAKYMPAPRNIQEELAKKYQLKRAEEQKK